MGKKCLRRFHSRLAELIAIKKQILDHNQNFIRTTKICLRGCRAKRRNQRYIMNSDNDIKTVRCHLRDWPLLTSFLNQNRSFFFFTLRCLFKTRVPFIYSFCPSNVFVDPAEMSRLWEGSQWNFAKSSRQKFVLLCSLSVRIHAKPSTNTFRYN